MTRTSSSAAARRAIATRAIAALADFFTAHELVFGHGTDNASDEAFWLLRHLTALARRSIGAHRPSRTSRRARSSSPRSERRRASRSRICSSEAWFAGLEFTVDERVLVPRSPLAEVIERGFAPWCALNPGDRVLDIGTGSGCIAIAVAHYCPDALVDATDVSAGRARRRGGERRAARRRRSACALFRADLFPPTRRSAIA